MKMSKEYSIEDYSHVSGDPRIEGTSSCFPNNPSIKIQSDPRLGTIPGGGSGHYRVFLVLHDIVVRRDIYGKVSIYRLL